MLGGKSSAASPVEYVANRAEYTVVNTGDDATSAQCATDSAAGDPIDMVYRSVCDLIACYRRQGSSGAALDDNGGHDQLVSLTLAEAALRLTRSATGQDERPPQLAVIGPTQVGKSTVVNLLVGYPVAEVSPLAGFTVHPQALWMFSDDAGDAWTAAVFPGWRQCSQEELTPEDLERYALRRFEPPFALCSALPAAAGPMLPACVVWDTPDFDTLSARRYERGVLEVAALADAYLLVLSKEKYSDLSVWTMLRLLAPLGRPLVICLNKLSPESAEAVERSLRERLAQFGESWGDVPIVPVEYVAELAADQANDTARAYPANIVSPLIEAATQRLIPLQRRSQAGLRALVEQHWSAWTAPVRTEHAALDEWGRLVEGALEKFLERYQRDYLEHPQRFDSFRRAAIELLNLLEIPKLSNWMTMARQTVTWPLRQLWGASRAWRKTGAEHDLGAEATVLSDTLETLLTGLQREVTRRCDPAAAGFAVWRAISLRLQSDEAELRDTFARALEAHHADVTREIHAAATNLYEELKTQPTRLAALRTARVTVDVGALLLAVKTGGLSPMDALWAPATFALSSLMVEGMAGVQMTAVSRSLRKKQYAAVQETLVENVLARGLRELAGRLDDAGLFGVSPGQLECAGQALRAWEQRESDA